MLIQVSVKKGRKEEFVAINKNIEFYFLNFFYNNRNLPFNAKTLHCHFKCMGYKQGYTAISLSKLGRARYLSEPEIGVYMMRDSDFDKIKKLNPQLAESIKLKINHNKENWQKSIF